ncbi:hypothetical protein GJ699_28180 [Duganella sp. FT80W]|uniref:YcxB-like C-terminal domain-containing protein n=1 Tax=Duganella guangzhouensis TaxID=2666084 RepID=A0A6I2LAV0_9BURK|nr:YcxB family protein [Duganella guangzhouensis]MRW93876.1 hypothetical protein [Duganella guangzhouensis]
MQDGQSQNVPISFHVSYRLGEYLSLVTSHVIADLRRRKSEQGKALRWYDLPILKGTLYLVGPPIFLFKVLRVGACDFKFDDMGIVRNSKSGELVVPWSGVEAIHEYPTGYLFAKGNGAMPVPLRALSTEQLVQLKRYIAQHRERVS